MVVFAGRHIPEKQEHLIPEVIAQARKKIPDLQAIIFGQGPDHQRIVDEIQRTGTSDIIKIPGFAPSEEVQETIAQALCLLLPSQREGYGLVVLEAAAAGTPVIVLAGEDNAATELIDQGVNGFVAPTPSDLETCVVHGYQAGTTLRLSTKNWFSAKREDLSAQRSANVILETYQQIS